MSRRVSRSRLVQMSPDRTNRTSGTEVQSSPGGLEGPRTGLGPTRPAAVARQLIASLRARDVDLRVEDSRLKYAPPNGPTDDDRVLLYQHRATIIRALTGPSCPDCGGTRWAEWWDGQPIGHICPLCDLNADPVHVASVVEDAEEARRARPEHETNIDGDPPGEPS